MSLQNVRCGVQPNNSLIAPFLSFQVRAAVSLWTQVPVDSTQSSGTMTLRPTHARSSGTEVVRAMQTTLRQKPTAGIPASTRNRLCFEKGVCAKLTCSICVTEEQNGLMTQALLFDQSLRPTAAALVTLYGLLLVTEVMESRLGPPHCLSGYVYTAGAPAQF